MRAARAAVVVLVVGVLATELTMNPTTGDRVLLGAIFLGVAVVTMAAAQILPRLAFRLRSLETTILLVTFAALGVAAAAVVLSAGLMFLSSHDLRLVMVSLGLGVALAVVLGAAVAGPITRDLRKVSAAADEVAGGDFSVRTGVNRPDEVGDAARSVDAMIVRLGEAEAERHRLEKARRHFVAAVGHDLRTPLTSIRAAVEALQDDLAPDPARYLASINSDAQLLDTMVEDFFLLARIEAGKLEFERDEVDLIALADEAVASMRPVAGRRRVHLERLGDGRVAVSGGYMELGRVIRNLVDNAIRFAPDDSTVAVQVAASGGAAEVRVVDEGPGFPAGFIGDAFEEFRRVDAARSRATGGTGLGLAIARGVIVAHGGEIWAEEGPGGRVGFRLPALA